MAVFSLRLNLKSLVKCLRAEADAAWRERVCSPPAQLWHLAISQKEPEPQLAARLNSSPRARYWLERIREAVQASSPAAQENVERFATTLMFVQLLARHPLARRHASCFAGEESPRSMEGPSDNELHRQVINELFSCVQNGSDQAYVQFLERYEQRLHNLAFYILTKKSPANHHDAEDVLNESVLQIYKQLKNKKFDSNNNGWAWVKRIVHNEAINLLRKRPPYIRASDLDLPEGDDSIWEPEDHAAKKQSIAIEVRDAVGELPDDLRSVVILFYFEGHSGGEIADILAIPVGTVHRKLHDARNALKELLGDRVEDSDESEDELQHGTNRVMVWDWLDTISGKRCLRLEHLLEPPGALYCVELLDGDGEGQADSVVMRRFVILRDGYPNAEAIISIDDELPSNGSARSLRSPYIITSLSMLAASSAETLWDSFEQQRSDDPSSARWWKWLAEREVPNLRIAPAIRGVLAQILSEFSKRNGEPKTE